MKHLFIVNPTAGGGKSAQKLKKLVETVFTPGERQVLYTEKAGDARDFARRAAQSGEDVRIYACGGDGTLNEVVNGAAGYSNAAVTHVPIGTGNDFLRIFGKKARAQFRDLAALKNGPQTAFDLMDCNGLLGLDVVCAGVDARVAAQVHRFKNLPLVGGRLAYILSLINAVSKGITRPMEISMGPIHYTGPTAILCICNGRYYGGGFCPVPEAMPDDGVLDMILIGDLPLLTFARYVGKYAAGKYRQCPPELVQSWKGTAVTFAFTRPALAIVDGETVEGLEFVVKLSEKKINFFYPAGASYRPR